jgi:hypothetical protein
MSAGSGRFIVAGMERQANHYFELRAQEERLAAANAADKRAAQAHRALADRYSAKARGGPVHEVAVQEDAGECGILPRDFRILP